MAAQAGAPYSQSPQAMTNGGGNSSRTVAAANIEQLAGETKSLLTTLFQHGGAAGLQQVLASVNPQRPSTHLSPLKPNPVVQQIDTPTHQTTPPISWAGRKRQRTDAEENTKRRRSMYTVGKSNEKQNKGLRHFSQLVCEKVREKGTTTYNEVADELVKELGDHERDGSGGSEHIDQKNIRRRVYDALNVLMAMNIISKEKKEIHWIGLPTNSVQECEHIQDELSQSEQRIQTKKSELHTLLIQILTMKALVRRNKERAERGETPSQNSAIGLPFILVNTAKSTTIDCSISSDKSEYVFNFDQVFELHQDFQVLKKMGLDFALSSGSCTAHGLSQAKSMLPKVFEPTLDEMAHVSALQSAAPAPVSILPPITNTPSQLPQVASTSTPTSSTLPPNVNPLLTPLLGDNSNGASSVSSSQSPLASLINMAKVTPPNAAAMAAAISSLQQLQQVAQSPLSRTLTSTGLTPTGLSSRTVTARPLNFAPSPLPTSKAHGSPTMQLKSQNIAPVNLVSSPSMHNVSPATKIVTAQPIPSAASISVAEILASLQKPMGNSLGMPVQNGGPPMGHDVNPLQSVSNSTAVSSSVSPLTPSTPNLLS